MISAFTKTKENQFFDLVCHLLGACAIVYILVRHALLEKSKLRPDAYECLDCSKAFCACVDCFGQEPTVARRGSAQAMDSMHTKIAYYFTFASIVGYVIYCMHGVVVLSSSLHVLPFAYCHFALKVSPILIVTSKCLMYAVFVGRLALGFKGSAFAYSKRVIRALYALVAFYGVVWDSLALVLLHGHLIKFSATNTHYCQMNDPGWAHFHFMIPFASLFDCCITFSLVYLFASALRAMLRERGAALGKSKLESDRISQADLYLLPLKYTVISTVAIVSSSTAWLLYSATGASFGVPLDCVVNCAALVLMNAKWQPIYDVVCSPLLRCVARCPCVDLTEAELVKQMRTTLTATNSEILGLGPTSAGTKPSRSVELE